MPIIATLLWLAHGVLLWRNWGRFRPHIALLHGLLVLAVGAAARHFDAPDWAMSGLGIAIGAAGAFGHLLAPGLWVGLGLQWLFPIMPGFPWPGLAFTFWALLAAAAVAAGRVIQRGVSGPS